MSTLDRRSASACAILVVSILLVAMKLWCRLLVGHAWSELVTDHLGEFDDELTSRDEFRHEIQLILDDVMTWKGAERDGVIEGLSDWLSGVSASCAGSRLDRLDGSVRRTIVREVCGS